MKSFTGILFLLIILIYSPGIYARQYSLYSGPPGGIYQYYISGIASIAKKNGYSVKIIASNGAVQNLRETEKGKADFAITNAGLLNGKRYKTNNVRALGCLYGSPGQLVVKSSSDIHSLYDLKGKRVGVGSIGSGAESSIEEVLKYLNLWDDVIVNFIGYNKAAEEFIKGNIDAFWVLSGIPNAAIVKTSEKVDIRLIDFFDTLEKTGFLKDKKYYTETVIPSYTYKNQNTSITTFQDKAVLITNNKVPSDVVYSLLNSIYSDSGLKFLTKIHVSARNIDIKNSLDCINVKLHPGAKKFWKDKGIIKKIN